MNERPIIGITMGDPAGCGPELSVKALRNPDVYKMCRPFVVGDVKMIEDSLRILKDTSTKINRIASVKEAKFELGTIDVYHLELVDMSKFEYGKVSAMCGEAAFQCVVKVIDLAMKGEIDGTVTNAFNKEAINLAGHHYSGHTEIYADYTHTKKYAMMLAGDDLRVVHVSTHVSLREACDRAKKERELECIRLANQACKQLGIARPKVGVCGLNPHAGENGLFGDEEINTHELQIPHARMHEREFVLIPALEIFTDSADEIIRERYIKYLAKLKENGKVYGIQKISEFPRAVENGTERLYSCNS